MVEEEIIYDNEPEEEIAIIGMAGRFPQANNIQEYWNNVKNGVESIVQYSDEELTKIGVPERFLKNRNYVKASAPLSNPYHFDATFFRYSPREAKTIDPQHRIFLETAWEALENSGYTKDSYDGSIGVFAGASPNYYKYLLFKNTLENDSLEEIENAIGNEKDYLATKVSYKFNLKGPSITMQTACSTSLVVVHTACQSLLNYQCSMAIAGAATVNLKDRYGYFYQQGTMASPDGHCRAFDINANGAVFGDGVGVVVLKRLTEAIKDRDYIYAIIKGTAINNDGAEKISFAAPSIDGQTEVIAMAHAISGVDADQISYVETHGTGTKLGDPIEIRALTKAFRLSTSKKQYCAIGSVKPNIGHTDAAAGMAGLIKLTKMIDEKLIPPSINYTYPNPEIEFENSPFYVSKKLTKWKPDNRKIIAGLSCFGFGGTNAHAILENYNNKKNYNFNRSHYLLLLSGETKSALKQVTKNLYRYLKSVKHEKIQNIAYTLQVGRQRLKQCRVIVCKDIKHAIQIIEKKNLPIISVKYADNSKKYDSKIVFMFSGQGSQYINMGKELYLQEKVFRQCINNCSKIIEDKYGYNLTKIIYPENDSVQYSETMLKKTEYTQPALFVIEYSLAKLLMSWGVQASTFIGHSIGEYVAACLSGVFTLDDALDLVATRGRLMQQLPKGDMLAVATDEKTILGLIGNDISLAAINAPNLCVVSGGEEKIKKLKRTLLKENIKFTELHTSHAFHSKMMEPILDPFIEMASKINMYVPKVPFISNIYGTIIKDEDATDPKYWAKHLRNEVKFSDGIVELFKRDNKLFIEIGPGNTLCTLARQHSNKIKDKTFISTLKHPKENVDGYEYLLKSIGKLWACDVNIDWEKFYDKQIPGRIPLPTYPFERKKLRVEGKLFMNLKEDVFDDSMYKEDKINIDTYKDNTKKNNIYREENDEVVTNLKKIWMDRLGVEEIDLDENFFELGGSSLIAGQIFGRLKDKYNISLDVSEIFKCPTIRELSEKIKKKLGGDFDENNIVKNDIDLDMALKYLGTI